MQFYENTFRKLYIIEDKKFDDTNFYAKIKLSPYQKGQAITVANALRRVLLSELDCIGIQSVQIQGVSHEFTVKPGIRESIPEIVSNLRQLAFRSGSKEDDRQSQSGGAQNRTNSVDNYTIVTKCEKDTPGVLYASSIELPNDIQCVAPNQKIATLISPYAHLHMNLVLTRSKQSAQRRPHDNMSLVSYETQPEDRQGASTYGYGFDDDKANEGKTDTKTTSSTLSTTSSHQGGYPKLLNAPFLPIDTAFNPVKKVNYSIHQEWFENMKQESIFLEIWTNGSLSPVESLAKTALILRQMFQPFTF